MVIQQTQRIEDYFIRVRDNSRKASGHTDNSNFEQANKHLRIAKESLAEMQNIFGDIDYPHTRIVKNIFFTHREYVLQAQLDEARSAA